MIEPTFENGKWWVLKDPDDQLTYKANVAPDLAVMGTSIASILPIVTGVEQLAEPTHDAGVISLKLGGFDTAPNAINKCVFRITCTNTERFDRTIWFRQVDN